MVFPSIIPLPSPANMKYFASIPFVFGLRLTLLTDDDFACCEGVDVETYVALLLIFPFISSAILLKKS